jgi:hypothetical protein
MENTEELKTKLKIRSLIYQIENDVKKTKQKMQDESYIDRYRKLRLRAYNTKSNEIIKRLNKILGE